MLEINNLTKIYKAKKGGAEVKALDGVSIKFSDTGMVFLLGKSGSGKSTLLNIAGGLDEPTEGEIKVMGKSSKNFSSSEFDSYRNTYVGFIFQEYNVLNEFSVEDNVGLALELQGKKRDKEKIAQILRTVELGAFAKRKPNTLSGGQKQRIAIARALVKDPQIIMADEPSGALDSATGKQVFDTLKKLSENRLVIVVSHDREFAEIYGDRIVELKDGKIISDVVKVKEPPHITESEITKIGEDTLCFNCGESVSPSVLKEIEKFILSGEGKVVITRGEKEIAGFNKINRIDDDGGRERFDRTDESLIKYPTYAESDAKFIRSKLPAKHALRIGASSLKTKPIRLIFTLFLATVAFIMFGMFSTMMLYNGKKVMASSFASSDYEYIIAEKNYRTNYKLNYRDETYYSHSPAKFTPAEVEKFTKSEGFGAYNLNLSATNVFAKSTKLQSLYQNTIRNLAYLPESHEIRAKISAGKYPENANEILISDFLYNYIKENTFYNFTDGEIDKNATVITDKNSLIGKYIRLESTVLKICGIFDNQIPSKFNSAYFEKDSNNYRKYNDYLVASLNVCAFVSPDFKSVNGSLFKSTTYEDNLFYYGESYLLTNPNGFFDSNTKLNVYETAKKRLKVTFIDPEDERKNEKLIVPLSMLTSLYSFEYDGTEEMVEKYQIFFKAANKLYNDDCDSEEDFENCQKTVLDYIKANPLKLDFYRGYKELDATEENFEGNYEIAGYSLANYQLGGIYCPQSLFERFVDPSQVGHTKYEEESDAEFDRVFIKYDRTETAFNKVYPLINVLNEQNDVIYFIENTLYSDVETANTVVDVLSNVFLWIGIILTLFASLLLFNFISVSISNKKKEIGILRAVGARSIDVFKIFICESSIIVSICAVLSMIGTAILTAVINGILLSQLGFAVKLFVFGPIPILFMLAIAVFVAFISTFLPVYLTARKKPVESIRAL